MKVEKLETSIGWKIEPQTNEEYRKVLSMIEALELQVNTEILDSNESESIH
jgi:hypothetical protein